MWQARSGTTAADAPQLTHLSALNSTSGLASLEDVGISCTLLWNKGLADVNGLARLTRIPG
jgi:hypothetical protein